MLAFAEEPKGEAPKNLRPGIESLAAKRRAESPAGDEPGMEEVRERDEARLREVCDGNAEGFFDLVKPNGDDLRWCGYSPVYTFLSSVSGVKGRVLEYEQWNIDDESVVSFTAMEFVRAEIQSSSL